MRFLLLLLISGCATRTVPTRRNDTTADVTGLNAKPGTSVTWFIGSFGCGIYDVSSGRSHVRDDGSFTVWWNAERAKFGNMELRAFVDTNDNWRCEEPAFLTRIEDDRADFAKGGPDPYGCMVLNFALPQSERSQ